jgi:hypothetical protein
MTDDIHDKSTQELTTAAAKPVQERRVPPRLAEVVRLLLNAKLREQQLNAWA